MVFYGVLFSIAPAVSTLLRDRAEARRWSTLRTQLEFVKNTTKGLADESGYTVQDLGRRLVELFRSFYWDQMRNELRFIVVALIGADRKIYTSGHPAIDVDADILKMFMEQLNATPALVTGAPFSALDVEQLLVTGFQQNETRDLLLMKSYLVDNRIEFCVPCAHDGELYGALLFGSKARGVFSGEELTALQLAASHAAIAVRNSHLIDRTKELGELDQVKRDLINNITHEFKSPLSVVDDAVGVLLADLKNGKVKQEKIGDYLLMVRENARRLGSFIQNLLEVAKIERPDLELNRFPVNLADLVTETIGLLESSIREKNLTLEVVTVPAKAHIDAEKIKQVVYNLVANALKFTQQGGIQVKLSTTEDVVRLVVKDTGRGIEPQFLNSIFDRFFQTPESLAANTAGTGLGLAIAKGWTEAHGGRIWAESGGLEKGSTFIVELPLTGVTKVEAGQNA
jgi:signal transduction histidine kinase